MKIIPLIWLNFVQYKRFINDDVNIEPVSGYHEVVGYRAYRIIFSEFTRDQNLMWPHLAINLSDDFELTAKYIYDLPEISISWDQNYGDQNDSNIFQMFLKLSEDEKLRMLQYSWGTNTVKNIKQYLQDHVVILKKIIEVIDLKSIHEVFYNFVTTEIIRTHIWWRD